MVRAYTIIEILLVISLISFITLYSIIHFYIPYTEKASLATSSFPSLRKYLYDIINYCNNHPGASYNGSMFSSCQPNKTVYGNLTFQVPNSTCTLDGQVPLGYKVKAFSTITNRFYAVCIYNETGIRCYITPTTSTK